MTERYQLLQMQYGIDPVTGETTELGRMVTRLSDMAGIPPDPENRDYQKFISDAEAGAEVIPYADPPAPVPASISDRQFFQQLAIDDIITEDEALAANAAVIPGPLLAIVNQLPAGQRFDAKMKISGATNFLRDDPLTIAIGQAYGMSAAEIDTFFVAAAAL